MEHYKIVMRNGHYEIYICGKFYCSADSMNEAIDEVERFLKEEFSDGMDI